MPSGELQFVQYSVSSDNHGQKRQQRVVHSTAARAAHAKRRRQRMKEFQSAKLQDTSHGQEVEPRHELALAAPNLVRAFSAGRTDPFSSFARPLKPVEHFLLDHCKPCWKSTLCLADIVQS